MCRGQGIPGYAIVHTKMGSTSDSLTPILKLYRWKGIGEREKNQVHVLILLIEGRYNKVSGGG